MQVHGDFLVGASYISKKTGSVLQRANIEYLDIRNNGFQPYAEDDPGYHNMGYFDNYIYQSGWTYNGYSVAHPFIKFLPGPDYQYTPLNKLWGINASSALHFSSMINPVIRIAYLQVYGNFDNPLEVPRHFVAADLTNVSILSDSWLITQQISWDIENRFGGGIVIRKKIF